VSDATGNIRLITGGDEIELARRPGQMLLAAMAEVIGPFPWQPPARTRRLLLSAGMRGQGALARAENPALKPAVREGRPSRKRRSLWTRSGRTLTGWLWVNGIGSTVIFPGG
jgi:hypothetical protein